MTDKIFLSQVDRLVILSTTTVLTAGQTIFSNIFPVGGFTHLAGFIFSDVSSATNGLIIEQAMLSTDFPAGVPATTKITRSLFTYPANETIANSYGVQLVAPFVRIVYTNGALPQTTFRGFFEARTLRGL